MQFPFNLGQFAQTSQAQDSGGSPVQAAVGAVPSWLGQMLGQNGGQFQLSTSPLPWAGQQSQQQGFSAAGPQGWKQVMQRPMGNFPSQQQAPQNQQQTPQVARPQQGQGAASPFGWMRQAPQMPQGGQGSAPQQGGRFGNMARALIGGWQ